MLDSSAGSPQPSTFPPDTGAASHKQAAPGDQAGHWNPLAGTALVLSNALPGNDPPHSLIPNSLPIPYPPFCNQPTGSLLSVNGSFLPQPIFPVLDPSPWHLAIPEPDYSAISAPCLHSSELSAPPTTRRPEKSPRRRQKNYICPVEDCSRPTESPSHLKRHIEAVHDKTKISCPVCGEKLSLRKSNLDRHLKSKKCRNHPLPTAGPSPRTS